VLLAICAAQYKPEEKKLGRFEEADGSDGEVRSCESACC
jgi:hypothetical protein